MQIERSTHKAIQAIEAAFRHSHYPGHEAIGDPNEGLESRDVAVDFKGKNWKSVPLDVLQRNNSGVFFSPIGWRYYLPAYMLAILKGLDDERPAFTSNIVSELVPSAFSHIIERYEQKFLEKVEPLTLDQKRAVKRFLLTLLENPRFNNDPQKALDEYWGQF